MKKRSGEEKGRNESEVSRPPDAEIPRAHFTPLSDSERAAIHARSQNTPHTQKNPHASIRRGIAWALLIILILLVVFLALNGG